MSETSDLVDRANDVALAYQLDPAELQLDPERQAQIDGFDAEYDQLEADRDAGTLDPETFNAKIAELQVRVNEARSNAPTVSAPRIGDIALGAGITTSNLYSDEYLDSTHRVSDAEDDRVDQ